MIASVVALIILVGIGYAVFRGFQQRSGGLADGAAPTGIKVDRLLVYAVSFAGLMAFLLGLAGLVTLILGETVLHANSLISASDARSQASYYLAALIVGTPLWLGFWRIATRRIDTDPAERQAPERRLYFAAAFAVTSVVALFAFHTVLRVVLEAPWSSDTTALARDGVMAGVRLVVYGSALVAYTRLAFRERDGNALDPARDLALWVLSAFSLAFLSIGLLNGLTLLVDEILGHGHHILLQQTQAAVSITWSDVAAWVLSGGVVWAALSRYIQLHPAVRGFRVVYLYVVLAVGVTMTLIAGTDLASELLRRAFGYTTPDTWGFLHDILPPLVVGGALWLVHWPLLRGLDESQGKAAIPRERRLYLASLSLAGLGMAAFGAVTLLWLVLDALIHPGGTGSNWWSVNASIGISLLAIGMATWLRPWMTLQAAAAADPAERAASERRWLLGAIVLIGALAGAGFAVAFLWQVFQVALGGSHDAGTIATILKDLSVVVVAGGLALYYARMLRADVTSAPGRASRTQLTALLAPGADGTVAALRKAGYSVEIAGYLYEAAPGDALPLAALEERIDSLQSTAPRALLILSPHGGAVLPYSRQEAMPEATARPMMSPAP
jgi:hypothetical protein